jgi:hypothetical protein
MAAISNLVRDIESQAITAAFAPTTGKYVDRGFLVMPAEDLTLEVITKEKYDLNKKTTVGLTAVSVFCSAGQWLECPIVYIGAESGKTVNIGLI